MENKEKTEKELGYDFHELVGAKVADNYLKQGGREGVVLAKKSLETILQNIDRYEPYVEDILTDPKNLEAAIKGQLETYNKYRDKETIAELINYHSNAFESYSAGGSERVKAEYNELLNMTYGEIMYKKEFADYIIKGEEFGRSSKQEAENAKKKSEKYQKLITTISLGENAELSEFKTGVEDNTMRETFNQMYPEKYKPKEK